MDLYSRLIVGWAIDRCMTQALQSIFEYIEVFYNRQRRHAFLDYMTPVEYEEKYA